jgi:hypothetical protein
LFELEALDEELFDVLGLFEADVRAEVLHELDDAVAPQVLVGFLFEDVGLGGGRCGGHIGRSYKLYKKYRGNGRKFYNGEQSGKGGANLWGLWCLG